MIYRKTKYDWIGDIPADWNLAKIGSLFNIGRGRVIAASEIDENTGDYPVYSSQTKNDGCMGYIDTFDYDCEQITWTTDGAYAGSVFYRTGKHNCTNVCGTLQLANSKKAYLKYCYYALQYIAPYYKRRDTNGYKIMNNEMADIVITLPPKNMQIQISKYLDRRMKYVDKLIIDLERQAEMLEIYRRELIANVVTKGLNRVSSMKNSGVDWMGDVPEHWNVTKLKWSFEIVKRIYGAEDRDVLSITQRGIKVKDIDSNDGQLAESYTNYQVVNVNDFAMNSMDLLTGWVDCSPYEGVTSPDYRVFRFHPDKPQCHTYYKYLFQMCYTNRIFYRLGQGVSNFGRWRLQADQFLNIRLPQPPIEEQEQIAAYLDKKVGQIEELTADIKAQIEKLKEYRKIVIHDAVTGKIKVTEGE